MRRWIELVAVLYPRSWREEFGPEFRALLDDVKPSWRVFRNVLGGAIEMQITAGTNWMKVAGGMAALGAIVAFGISFREAPLYSSSAVISVTPQADPVRATSEQVLQERAADRVAEMEAEILSRRSLFSIISNPQLQLYEWERQRKPLEDVIGEMRRNIRIEAFPQAEGLLAPGAFRISFSYPDPVKAQAAVDALSLKFTELNTNINKTNGDAYRSFWRDMADVQHTKPAPPPPVGDVVRIVDSASKPVGAEGPNRFQFLAWGLGVGLLPGLLAAFGMRRPRGIRRLIGFGVAGFVLAAALSFLIPNRYTSNAVMQISPAQITEDPMAPLPAATPAAEFLRQIEPEVLSFQNLSKIIQDRRVNLYAEERATKPMEEVVRNMLANDLRIAPVPAASGAKGSVSAFSITFSYSDRFKAQMVVQMVMNTIDEVNQNRLKSEGASQSYLLHQITQRKAGEVLDVLDVASLPGSPSKPNRVFIALIGLVVGLVLGMIRVERSRPRVAELATA